MKACIWIGWVVTGLMTALMLLSAVPDVLRIPGALTVFRHLGYPAYLLPFLGTAKILGVAAVLTPGDARTTLRRIVASLSREQRQDQEFG